MQTEKRNDSDPSDCDRIGDGSIIAPRKSRTIVGRLVICSFFAGFCFFPVYEYFSQLLSQVHSRKAAQLDLHITYWVSLLLFLAFMSRVKQFKRDWHSAGGINKKSYGMLLTLALLSLTFASVGLGVSMGIVGIARILA